MVCIKLRLCRQCCTLEIGALENPIGCFAVPLTRIPPDAFFRVRIVVAYVLTELQPREDGEGSFYRWVDADKLRFREVLSQGKEWVVIVVPRERTTIRPILFEGIVGGR